MTNPVTEDKTGPMPMPRPVTAMALRAPAPPAPVPLWRRAVLRFAVLALLWGVLTEFRPDALIFGLPAVLAAVALSLLLPAPPGWRLSLTGALTFAMWFAVNSVRGAVDVAWRAFRPALPLDPGFRSYRPILPAGAPRVMFLNTITLLPGTLSAQVEDEQVIVHMLDMGADLEANLAKLEQRIARLFALDLATKEKR
ncbi:MAG: Na+/H+ antiporter subunit E [Paracoccus sp. (in: a-proteobacteria)]|nr:Na+/H+ antiporter subunit E [Paracoccus sp. (in: a-proteobacteria)]